MTRRAIVSSLCISAAICTSAVAGSRADHRPFTSDFNLEDCRIFVPNGSNDFWSLKPGTFVRLEGEEDGEYAVVEITVTGAVRPIVFQEDGKTLLAFARVIVEREWIDGELVEVSYNFYARCRRTNNIYYFGEEVDIYEDGEIVSHDGEWLAGKDGASPGLIMPGLWLLGSRYYQEMAPDAQDRAEHTEMGFDYTTEFGVTFTDCVRIVETTPLEPGEESIKIYARGVGIIFDDGIERIASRTKKHHPHHAIEDTPSPASRSASK